MPELGHGGKLIDFNKIFRAKTVIDTDETLSKKSGLERVDICINASLLLAVGIQSLLFIPVV